MMKCLLATAIVGLAWFLTLAWADPMPVPFATTPLRFPPHSGSYAVLPIRVVDGDTVHFYWLVEDTGRLAFINAPELPTTEGKESKDELAKMLTLDRPMRVSAHGRDKYGRALIELFGDDGISLNKKMVDAGKAKNYP